MVCLKMELDLMPELKSGLGRICVESEMKQIVPTYYALPG